MWCISTYEALSHTFPILFLIMIVRDFQGKANIPILEVRKLRFREQIWWPKVILFLASQQPGSKHAHF